MVYLLALGVAAAALATMLLLARKSGSDAVRLEDEKRDAQAAAHIATAVANAPHDRAELIERLRDRAIEL
jgi:hypothetical protein